MTERLIDAVCPHCGRVGTTVRVVLQEDGHTKLSRRCTDCGGECIHTFDHDWLAAANNKKLRSENERLTSDVALVAERVRQLSEERDYAWAEVEKQRAENERLRAEMLHLAEWCEMEVPLTHDYMAYLMRFAAFRLRKALEGKP